MWNVNVCKNMFHFFSNIDISFVLNILKTCPRADMTDEKPYKPAS